MEIIIRQEQKQDYPNVFQLIQLAFKDMPESDHQEQFLVERIRHSDGFIPELSLVAESDGKIIGYLLLSKVEIITGDKHFPSLALAPVAVLPSFQYQGVGSKLIREAHRIAAQIGYHSALVLGHSNYYPRFGYRPAQDFNIVFPFDVPSEYCMAIELIPEGLKEVHGMVKYPDVFFE